jgi:hypothetical protein
VAEMPSGFTSRATGRDFEDMKIIQSILNSMILKLYYILILEKFVVKNYNKQWIWQRSWAEFKGAFELAIQGCEWKKIYLAKSNQFFFNEVGFVNENYVTSLNLTENRARV